VTDQQFIDDLRNAVKDGLRKAVTEKLTGYNSPLDKMLAGIIEGNGNEIRNLLTSAVASSLSDDEWRESIAKAVRSKLASILIQRFGGELEKQVNTLKSDPATRARITLAIENIVAEASKK